MNARFLISFFAVILPAAGWACTDLQFESLARTVSFDGNATPVLTFNVRANTTSGGCDFFVAFGNGGAISSGSRRLSRGDETWPFNLYKDVSRLKILKDAGEATGPTDVLTGSFKSANGISHATLALHASLDPLNLNRSMGPYREDVVFSLFEGAPRTGMPVTTALVRFSATVSPQTRLSVVQRGKSANVELETNTDVTLKVSGKNAGVKTYAPGRWALPVDATDAPVTVTVESRD